MAAQPAELVRYFETEPGAIRTGEFSPPEQAVLDAVNQKVGAQESLARLVDFLAATTREVSPCDRVSVAFVEDDGRRLVAYYTRAAYEPVLLAKGYAETIAGSSLADVIAHGAPRVIDDLAAYLAARPDSRATRLLVREGVRSSLTCPLHVEGRIVGVLFRSSRRPGAYDVHQVRLHLAVAERLGQAVEKAWRIEQLTEARRAYFEMLGFVVHELKSPLSSIIVDANLMLEGYLGELADAHKERLQRMVRKARGLLDLTGDFLSLARVEGALALQARRDVDLARDVLNPVLQAAAAQIEAAQMSLDEDLPADAPPAECDPQLLRIVAANLLSNAVKYGRAHGVIRVAVRPTPTHVAISFWNEGPGWAPEARERLFRRFSRLSTPDLPHKSGTGLGLYTAWRIVQLHGGELQAESEAGRWAEFRVVLPQPLPAAGAIQ